MLMGLQGLFFRFKKFVSYNVGLVLIYLKIKVKSPLFKVILILVTI